MANISTQYTYTGKGPLDAKNLVQTLSKLYSPDSYNNYAYNGMIVGVGLDATPTNNGIYYLYDSSVKNARGTPDVTKAENWHKIANLDDLDFSKITERLETLENAGYLDSTAVEQKINAIIETLNTTIADLGEAKTLASLKQENGIIIADVVPIKIESGQVSDFSTAVADLISEGSENGTIKVNNADVHVHGLKDLAYTSSADFVATIIGKDSDTKDSDTITGAKLYTDDKVKSINDKLVGVTTTVADLIDSKIQPATADTLGTVKSSTEINTINVNNDGIATVNSLSISKLVQTVDDMLTLDGGDIA